jgi:hypothetical protein
MPSQGHLWFIRRPLIPASGGFQTSVCKSTSWRRLGRRPSGASSPPPPSQGRGPDIQWRIACSRSRLGLRSLTVPVEDVPHFFTVCPRVAFTQEYVYAQVARCLGRIPYPDHLIHLLDWSPSPSPCRMLLFSPLSSSSNWRGLPELLRWTSPQMLCKQLCTLPPWWTPYPPSSACELFPFL